MIINRSRISNHWLSFTDRLRAILWERFIFIEDLRQGFLVGLWTPFWRTIVVITINRIALDCHNYSFIKHTQEKTGDEEGEDRGGDGRAE